MTLIDLLTELQRLLADGTPPETLVLTADPEFDQPQRPAHSVRLQKVVPYRKKEWATYYQLANKRPDGVPAVWIE